MFLMEDYLESFSFMESQGMTILTKIYSTIGLVKKSTYNLIYNTYMYLKKVED